jgi:LemA protein
MFDYRPAPIGRSRSDRPLIRRPHPPFTRPRDWPVQKEFPMVVSRKILSVAVVASALTLSGCGYNDFQRLDEQVKAGWSEVLNQYQRRADLIPNIVNTVKGEANFEQETLTKVIEARSRATSIQATPELINNPEAFQKFQAAQGELSGALSRLMVVSERYPALRANQAFQDLRVQLEGTENRITVARNRYIKTVQEYNVLTRSFPTNLTAMMFSYQVKPNFAVEDEKAIAKPPTVSFDKPAAAPAPANAAPAQAK